MKCPSRRASASRNSARISSSVIAAALGARRQSINRVKRSLEAADTAAYRAAQLGAPSGDSPRQPMTFGVDMKRIGWAIALAAAFLTPAAAMAQAQPSEAAAPSSVADTGATQAPAAAAGQNQMAADQNGTGGAAQVATTPFHYTQPSQA